MSSRSRRSSDIVDATEATNMMLINAASTVNVTVMAILSFGHPSVV